jgi:ABC-type antimicrobial peptide transport system permease subunit
MMSYAVTRRTIEFGIRMALGAEPAKLFGAVMGQGLLLTAAGAGAGAVGAFFLTRLLQGLVFGVQTFDLRSFVLTLAVLILATVIAMAAPAARVIRIEPVQALREE